jgi:guanylate kinase
VRPFPLILSAPSGGGKTTIARALVKARDDLGYSVSATTRAPRPGERDGHDYHFLSGEAFEQRVRSGEFLEWVEYGGERYGTLRSEVFRVLDSGRHVVLDIEPHGARAIRAQLPGAVLVFIVPPSAEELLRRLGGPTGTRSQSLPERLGHAVRELEAASEYDYVVLNADHTAAVAEVAAILDAEGRRPSRLESLEAELAALGRDISALAERLAPDKGGAGRGRRAEA